MTNPSTQTGRLHPRIQAVVSETGVLTPFFFKWLVTLWERTGGFDDAISPAQIDQFGFVSNSLLTDEQIEEVVQSTEVLRSQPLPITPQFISRSVSSDYDATSFELVSMAVKGTISLPQYPNDNDQVKLFNKNGKQITLSGNGNTIDGETAVITIKKNTLLCVQYFSEVGEWIIV